MVSGSRAATASRGPAAGHEPRARFGIFGVGAHLVGVSVTEVQEMFVLQHIHRPPGLAPHQRGVATLRGAALPAVDLRVCLGLSSSTTELADMLQLMRDREQDHRNWLGELEASIREERPFTLATDPTRCKFGQWLDSFQTDDAVLRGELLRIREPHAAVHGMADQVTSLAAAGRVGEALQAIERTRAGLMAGVLKQFEQIRRALREQHREIGVTVTLGGRRCLLIVDRAEAVADLERIPESEDPMVAGQLRTDLALGMAHWTGARQPVVLLDLERLATL